MNNNLVYKNLNNLYLYYHVTGQRKKIQITDGMFDVQSLREDSKDGSVPCNLYHDKASFDESTPSVKSFDDIIIGGNYNPTEISKLLQDQVGFITREQAQVIKKQMSLIQSFLRVHKLKGEISNNQEILLATKLAELYSQRQGLNISRLDKENAYDVLKCALNDKHNKTNENEQYVNVLSQLGPVLEIDRQRYMDFDINFEKNINDVGEILGAYLDVDFKSLIDYIRNETEIGSQKNNQLEDSLQKLGLAIKDYQIKDLSILKKKNFLKTMRRSEIGKEIDYTPTLLKINDAPYGNLEIIRP